MPVYALTIFIGAFLLFQVQPLIGKYILPWFGGGPGVWTTCMLFFQVALLAGYAYAHLISQRLQKRTQAIVHLCLVVTALALLPVTPSDSWKPRSGENPTLHIMLLLTATIGLPYFVLSSTGPLLQQWFTGTHPGRSPYRLYALSNAGSLLALVSYPFFFEAHLTRKSQATAWAWGLMLYAVGCVFCALKLWRAAVDGSVVLCAEDRRATPAPSILTRVLWLLWPACGSVLLLAITNKICQDVAVVPFLWVLPLALYLLSFVICFDNPRWYAPAPFTFALTAALGAICWALWKGTGSPLRVQLSIYSAGLFVCCMVCHGELYQLKPHPRHLTGFYLMIAAGGALGGLFVALVAPMLFRSYYELHWGLLVCALLFTAARTREENPFSKFQQTNRLACAWLWIGCLSLGAMLWLHGRKSSSEVVYTARNFYGVLKVFEHRKNEPTEHHFLLQHGRITHGLQFADRQQAAWPTTYYGEQSGLGLAMHALPPWPRRIGVVGLGTGTVAAYAEAGDYVRMYEINPEVKRLATSCFTYLSNCLGRVEVVLGDARLSLEREPPQEFDLLVLDAFSSDAIPVHLLTREAFALYERHRKPTGMLAVHISNHYLDLEPVVLNLGRQFNYQASIIDYDETEDDWWLYSSTWILLTRNNEILTTPAIRWAATPPRTNWNTSPIWTDDYASLFQILK